MVIELNFPENPDWNPTLNAKNLILGDYIDFTVDKFWKEIPSKNPEYGSSFMYFVTVFEYSYYDAKARNPVDKKFPSGQKATYFANARVAAELDKYIEQPVRLEAVETKGGRVAYGVAHLDKVSSNEDSSSLGSDDVKVTSPDLPNEHGPELVKLVNEFKKLGFDEDAVVNSLKANYPEESIREVFKLN